MKDWILGQSLCIWELLVWTHSIVCFLPFHSSFGKSWQIWRQNESFLWDSANYSRWIIPCAWTRCDLESISCSWWWIRSHSGKLTPLPLPNSSTFCPTLSWFHISWDTVKAFTEPSHRPSRFPSYFRLICAVYWPLGCIFFLSLISWTGMNAQI